jgi:hypothetical protein
LRDFLAAFLSFLACFLTLPCSLLANLALSSAAFLAILLFQADNFFLAILLASFLTSDLETFLGCFLASATCFLRALALDFSSASFLWI